MLRCATFSFLIFVLHAATAHAQSATPQPLEIQESGAEYLKSIRFRRIDSNVGYFDPTRPAPALDTNARVRQPEQRTEGQSSPPPRSLTALVGVVLLAMVVYFAVRFSGNFAVSFGSNGDTSKTAAPARRTVTGETDAQPAELAAIVNMPDRRQAVVVLAQAALLRAAQASDLLLQRSWTARDVLRRIKTTGDGYDALRPLVLASEKVHFGRRDISQEDFDDLVSAVRPMFSRARQ